MVMALSVSVSVCEASTGVLFDDYLTVPREETKVSKVLRDVPMSTAKARAELVEGAHWRSLDADIHLGYRKGKRGGAWLVRWRDGRGYKQAKLGTADDVIKVGTLSFEAAKSAARRHVADRRIDAQVKAAGPVETVRSAVESYIVMRDARDSARQGRAVRSDAAQRLGRYVLGIATRGNAPVVAPLASIELHRLREADLQQWLAGLPSSMGAPARLRLANDLKAALNATCDRLHETLPMTIPVAIKRGLRVMIEGDETLDIARENQILSDTQITQLLGEAKAVDAARGWEGDLYRLLVVLAGTGMRMAQIVRMRVRDVQRDLKRLQVPASRKGKGKKQQGYIAVPVGQDVLDVLLAATVGRGQDEVLLERWRYGQAPGGIEWIKDRRGAWRSSSEINRDWQTIKTRAGLTHADPYAFRHSSIVRALRANLPIRLVAAQHDTSVAMIERHYSRFIVDGLEELVARAVVPLVPRDTSNLLRLA